MFSEKKKRQIDRVQRDKSSREQYVDSQIRNTLAHQIRLTRESRGWTQRDLADRLGVTQNQVSRWESSDYGKLTLSTLKRVASAFDIGLMVRFVPFSRMIDWQSSTTQIDQGLSVEDLEVPSFDQELQAGLFSEKYFVNLIPMVPAPREMTPVFFTRLFSLNNAPANNSKPMKLIVPAGFDNQTGSYNQAKLPSSSRSQNIYRIFKQEVVNVQA